MADQKPAWGYWLNLAEVPLEAAICLSLDLAPSILDELDERYARAERVETLREFRIRFIARRDAAKTHIRKNNLEARYNSSESKYFVSLEDFRNWGESLPIPLTFPEEFPKPKVKDELAPLFARNGADDAALNPKREKTLLRMIRALAALAELPERGAAKEVVAKLQGLGFRSPDDDTVREVLNEARKLEPD